MLILRDNFDMWRTQRARDRPKVWSSLTPKMIIDVILWKLENTVLAETVIGEYAAIAASYMIKRNFDCTVIDNRFSLANKPQAKIFAV